LQFSLQAASPETFGYTLVVVVVVVVVVAAAAAAAVRKTGAEFKKKINVTTF
jgi:type II secretory pathway pseudopilin PulG